VGTCWNTVVAGHEAKLRIAEQAVASRGLGSANAAHMIAAMGVEDRGALTALDFGRVDSESENDLDRRFLRTADFDRFLDQRNLLVIGAKGSGKSALFEMFAKFQPVTRELAGERMNGVLIATGTGLGDVREMTTTDIQGYERGGEFQYEGLWKLYIALKAAFALGAQGYSSNGPLRDLLRIAGQTPDYRIGPILGSIWGMVGGPVPDEVEVSVMGTGVRIRAGKQSVDVLDLLADVEDVLQSNGNRLWLLFDKIDELHSADPARRKTALEGLFPSAMAVQRAFPSIVPRIFIRSDIYADLNFTNKSHLADKQFELKWDERSLRTLLIKRGFAAEQVRSLADTRIPQIAGQTVEQINAEYLMSAFHVLFDERAYPGRREAETLAWMIARATDAKGGTFPRELISYGNIAREIELEKGGPLSDALISNRSVVDAYYPVSELRRTTFLSEFPDLEPHFRRFRGQRDVPFQRSALHTLFEGLEPSGDEAIERLHEVGVLAPTGNRDVSVADAFEVPRLYRAGLGLQIIARP
jgi:hypothetical protein